MRGGDARVDGAGAAAARRVSAGAERASLDEAWAWLDALRPRVSVATVPAAEAVGRVLVFDLHATRGLPQVARAAMDGHAVRAQETEGAGPYNPLPVTAAPVRAGEAMPEGTDAVLPADHFEAGLALDAVAQGENVVAAGSELREGSRALPAGRVIRPQDLPVLDELGVARVQVRAGLGVVLDVDAALVPLAESLLLRDLSRQDGARSDLVVTTGDRAGDRWAVRAIAMRPGFGHALGKRGARTAIRLPRDPLGFAVGYEVLAARLLRREAGMPEMAPAAWTLGGKIVSAIGLTDLALVRLEGDRAVPLPGIDSGGAPALARADGYVVVPPTREGFAAGDLVRVHRFAS